jgi:hypothetical protein
MRAVEAGMLYFALTFAAGFVLGAIRVTWMVPRIGTRMAELAKIPLMLLVTILAARWVVRRLALPAAPAMRIGVGCIALGLLLAAEFFVVLRLRGVTIGEYFASRDPVAGTVYLVMLGVFAIMPLLVR